MTYLGIATGPALGGILTHHFGWRAIFFINVPIGLVAVPLSYRAMEPDSPSGRQPFDLAGAVGLAVALACLLFTLSKGARDGMDQPDYSGGSLHGGRFSCGFRADRDPNPSPNAGPAHLLQPHIQRLDAGGAAQLYGEFLGGVSDALFFDRRQPLSGRSRWIAVNGYLGGDGDRRRRAGWLSDRIGVALPATAGMAITIAGLLALRTLDAGAPPLDVITHLALIGLGIGLFTSPNNSAIMGSAPGHGRGHGGRDTRPAARSIGFALGTATAGTLYMRSLHALEGKIPEAARHRSVNALRHDGHGDDCGGGDGHRKRGEE